MQTAQRIIQSYRHKRAIFCVVVAAVALICTLAFRFISERNINQQRIVAYTSHAVQTLDRLIQPLIAGRDVVTPLVGMSCDDAHQTLRKQAASLQTVRAIALIENGILYCSSIFGHRNVPVHQLQPSLPASQPLMALSTDQSLLKDQPILILWYPTREDGQNGVLEVVNIELLSNLMLEPQEPLITRVNLSVNGRHLVQGKGVMDQLPPQQDEKHYQQSSTQFPFAISVSGPGAEQLALQHLPSQLPLALMMSFLTGFIAPVCDRQSHEFFLGRINLGLAAHEFELFCQPVISASNLQCTGVEILLRWYNPRQGWISPEVFIPIAEDHHLIAPLTRYVITETARQRELFLTIRNFILVLTLHPVICAMASY